MAYVGNSIPSADLVVPQTAARRAKQRFSRDAKVRGRLFRKYVGLFVAVVCVALFANGLFEIWFSYQEHKAALIRIQREQAEAAAAKIGQFVKEIEGQLGWTVRRRHVPRPQDGSADPRRTGAQDPKDTVEHAPVIHTRHTARLV